MFKDNKYTKIYYQIIQKATGRINEGYVEKHHIIPKSCGGSDDVSNLVSLTKREHFLCHWLLTKMVEGEHLRNMHYAFKLMSNYGKTKKLQSIARTTGANRSEDTKSKISQTMKKQYATGARKKIAGMKGKTLSEKAKCQISNTHKGKPKSEPHKEKLRQNLKGKTWKLIDGKRMWFDKGCVNV